MPDLTRIQLRRGTTANWTSSDPILAAGEVGVEITSTTTRFKIGNGTLAWSSLPYYDNVSVLDNAFATDIAVTSTLSNYVLSTTLSIVLGSYSTTAQINTTLSAYVLDTDLANYYTITTTDQLLAAKANSADSVLTGTTQAVNLLVTGTTDIDNLLVSTSATINSAATVLGELTSRTYTANVSTTSSAIDFSTEAFKTLTITAATTSFTATNYGIGRTISALVTNGTTTSLALVFPSGWTFVGNKPTTIAGNKKGILTITSFSTTESQCIAAWAVQT